MSPFSELRLPSPHELPGEDGRSAAQAQAQAQAQAPALVSAGVEQQHWPLRCRRAGSPTISTARCSTAACWAGARGAAVLDDSTQERRQRGVPQLQRACAGYLPRLPQLPVQLLRQLPALPRAGRYCWLPARPGRAVPLLQSSHQQNGAWHGWGAGPGFTEEPGQPACRRSGHAVAFPAMQQDIPGAQSAASRPVDSTGSWTFLWLVAVVLMVWALTQLPTWLNLPGMY